MIFRLRNSTYKTIEADNNVLELLGKAFNAETRNYQSSNWVFIVGICIASPSETSSLNATIICDNLERVNFYMKKHKDAA